MTATTDVPHADVAGEPARSKCFPLGSYDGKPQRRIEHEWVVREHGEDTIMLQLDCWHARGGYVASVNNAVREPGGVWITAPMSANRISLEHTARYSKAAFQGFAARALQILRDAVANGELGEYVRGEQRADPVAPDLQSRAERPRKLRAIGATNSGVDASPRAIMGAGWRRRTSQRRTESGDAMGLIDEAIARSDARPVKRIDYDRMKRVFPRQKAALTRAVKTNDPEEVAAVCVAAMNEWDEIGAWPDDWSRWQRALDDVLPWGRQVDLQDLRR